MKSPFGSCNHIRHYPVSALCRAVRIAHSVTEDRGKKPLCQAYPHGNGKAEAIMDNLFLPEAMFLPYGCPIHFAGKRHDLSSSFFPSPIPLDILLWMYAIKRYRISQTPPRSTDKDYGRVNFTSRDFYKSCNVWAVLRLGCCLIPE